MFAFLKRFRKPAWLAPTVVEQPPAPLFDHKSLGLKWVKSTSGDWIEVCSFCGGNCGQCGNTSRIGNVPASMTHMVAELTKGN